MSTYTKEQVIEGRKCGLKYWDESIALKGREAVINEAISISKQYPDVWGKGWPNVTWAIVNAVIEIVNRGQISQNWNLDEALTQDEIKHIAKELNLNMNDYKPLWNRKVLKHKPITI